MVKVYSKSGKKFFGCEECGRGFADQKIAAECEDFCKKHSACSMEITRKAEDYPE